MSKEVGIKVPALRMRWDRLKKSLDPDLANYKVDLARLNGITLLDKNAASDDDAGIESSKGISGQTDGAPAEEDSGDSEDPAPVAKKRKVAAAKGKGKSKGKDNVAKGEEKPVAAKGVGKAKGAAVKGKAKGKAAKGKKGKAGKKEESDEEEENEEAKREDVKMDPAGAEDDGEDSMAEGWDGIE